MIRVKKMDRLRNVVVMLMMTLMGIAFQLGSVNRVLGDDAVKGPSAYLPESLYEFSGVMEGDSVFHDFVIQNRGDAPLVIVKVRAG
jgi:hypothetical protein